MNSLRYAAALLFALAVAIPFWAADDKKDDGFVPLFNGKDLTGWVNVNCAPSTFFVKDGEIITTGKPVGYLRTARMYENFIAEFDWMHINTKEVGNSGFFVWGDPLPVVGSGYTRGIEVQVLVNLTYKDKKTGEITATSQGDLFSIQGATCKPDRPHPKGAQRCLPSENRCKGGGEWNHYKVIAQNGVIKLHVNGKEVSGVSECKPRKGYLALESEGAECHFRNLKIKELPSTNPRPEEVADEAKDFKNLFTGLDLSGWKADDEAKNHWKAREKRVLHYDGMGGSLQTEKAYGNSEFILDFRFPKNDSKPCNLILREGANLSLTAEGKVQLTNLAPGGGGFGATTNFKSPGQWNRLQVTTRGKSIEVAINGKRVGTHSADTLPDKGHLKLYPEGEMDFGNLFVRKLEK